VGGLWVALCGCWGLVLVVQGGCVWDGGEQSAVETFEVVRSVADCGLDVSLGCGRGRVKAAGVKGDWWEDV